MKKVIVLLSVVIVMLYLGGCMSLFNGIFRSEELSNDYSNETQVIAQTEEMLIRAIESNDSELLKSMFSVKALSVADDIDRGIEHIFSLFEGDIVEIDGRNHSSMDHTEKTGRMKRISAVCRITTTHATYTMNYVFYPVQELDTDAKGVYALRLQKNEEPSNYDGNLYRIAGIDYPERLIIHKTADEIATYLYDGNYSGLKSLFSEQALAECEDFENGSEYLSDMYTGFKVNGFNDSWMSTEVIDSVVRYHAFLDIKVSRIGRCLLYFCYDESQDSSQVGVYRIKITKITGKDIMDECGSLGNTYERSGIYYPGWDQ